MRAQPARLAKPIVRRRRRCPVSRRGCMLVSFLALPGLWLLVVCRFLFQRRQLSSSADADAQPPRSTAHERLPSRLRGDFSEALKAAAAGAQKTISAKHHGPLVPFDAMERAASSSENCSEVVAAYNDDPPLSIPVDWLLRVECQNQVTGFLSAALTMLGALHRRGTFRLLSQAPCDGSQTWDHQSFRRNFEARLSCADRATYHAVLRPHGLSLPLDAILGPPVSVGRSIVVAHGTPCAVANDWKGKLGWPPRCADDGSPS